MVVMWDANVTNVDEGGIRIMRGSTAEVLSKRNPHSRERVRILMLVGLAGFEPTTP